MISDETRFALSQMLIIDLAFYHSFLVLIGLTLASVDPDNLDI